MGYGSLLLISTEAGDFLQGIHCSDSMMLTLTGARTRWLLLTTACTDPDVILARYKIYNTHAERVRHIAGVLVYHVMTQARQEFS